jgi:hypothetical protein
MLFTFKNMVLFGSLLASLHAGAQTSSFSFGVSRESDLYAPLPSSAPFELYAVEASLDYNNLDFQKSGPAFNLEKVHFDFQFPGFSASNEKLFMGLSSELTYLNGLKYNAPQGCGFTFFSGFNVGAQIQNTHHPLKAKLVPEYGMGLICSFKVGHLFIAPIAGAELRLWNYQAADGNGEVITPMGLYAGIRSGLILNNFVSLDLKATQTVLPLLPGSYGKTFQTIEGSARLQNEEWAPVYLLLSLSSEDYSNDTKNPTSALEKDFSVTKMAVRFGFNF